MSSTMFFAVMAVAGVAIMVTTAASFRKAPPELDSFLGDLIAGDTAGRLQTPLLRRLVADPISRRLGQVLPGSYLENLEKLLAQAGLSGVRTAGQQMAIQLGLGLAGAAVSGLVLVSRPASGLGLVALMLPVIGFMLPSARLKRTVRSRSDQIFKDLPDIIDMLAIAVEAGSGFEAALTLICEHFRSPMADELAWALNEMSLGMPRREALKALKDRADLDVVRTFALALIQADALGIPISRVLRSQATEIRARRRAWAREKAAKMPVKILFPLVLFVFPPILAIVMGPAAMSFTHL